MKDKWAKDVCPFCKDQGFDSIIGDPKPGETVISFSHTISGASEALVIETETAKALLTPFGEAGRPNGRVIHQMRDTLYRVFISRADEGDEAHAESNATYIGAKTLTGFTIYGESGYTYDICIVGRVNF